jgi:hypothetical protein
VGNHGRDARRRVAACAILATTWVAPLLPQASSDFRDLLPELASNVAALVGSNSAISVSVSSRDSTGPATDPLHAQISQLLSARGLRIVEPRAGVAAVGISCAANLRERACTAEVDRNAQRDVLIVTKRHEAVTALDSRPPVNLELRPLISQRTVILDAVRLGDRLLVLDGASVALYQQTARGWQEARVRALPASRVWPRDLRGRLRVDGERVAVFLPGMICFAGVSELNFNCTEGRMPWPVGIENTGLEPGRNYYLTPEGLPFFSAAALGAKAGARWVVAGRDGTVRFLDDARTVIANGPTADDLAALSAPCDEESYVLAGIPVDGREAVRLFQVSDQRAVAVASPMFLPGKLTALWTMSATTAVAVTHDVSGERYDASLVTVSCGA